jgi:hypothetical protein
MKSHHIIHEPTPTTEIRTQFLTTTTTHLILIVALQYHTTFTAIIPRSIITTHRPIILIKDRGTINPNKRIIVIRVNSRTTNQSTILNINIIIATNIVTYYKNGKTLESHPFQPIKSPT